MSIHHPVKGLVINYLDVDGSVIDRDHINFPTRRDYVKWIVANRDMIDTPDALEFFCSPEFKKGGHVGITEGFEEGGYTVYYLLDAPAYNDLETTQVTREGFAFVEVND